MTLSAEIKTSFSDTLQNLRLEDVLSEEIKQDYASYKESLPINSKFGYVHSRLEKTSPFLLNLLEESNPSKVSRFIKKIAIVVINLIPSRKNKEIRDLLELHPVEKKIRSSCQEQISEINKDLSALNLKEDRNNFIYEFFRYARHLQKKQKKQLNLNEIKNFKEKFIVFYVEKGKYVCLKNEFKWDEQTWDEQIDEQKTWDEKVNKGACVVENQRRTQLEQLYDELYQDLVSHTRTLEKHINEKLNLATSQTQDMFLRKTDLVSRRTLIAQFVSG